MPSTMGLMSRLAWQRLRKSGVAVSPLLKKARLTSDLLEDVESRLGVRDQVEFLHLAAEELGDEMLGFHLAQEFDLRRAGMYYYVLSSSQNLHELFARGARYSTLVNEGLSQRFVDDKRVGLAARYLDSRRPIDRHQLEFWITSLVRVCRACTGTHVKPRGSG